MQLLSAEPGRQNKYPKCTHKNSFYGLPRTHCLLDSIDHGKFKSVRAPFFFSSSSRACHPLIHCISKYYKQVTKCHCVSFPTGYAVYIYSHFLFFLIPIIHSLFCLFLVFSVVFNGRGETDVEEDNSASSSSF